MSGKVFFLFIFLVNTTMASSIAMDVSRIESAQIQEVQTPQNVISIQDLVKQTARKNLKISIAGRRHSQGGHTFADGVLQIDMTQFKQVLKLDQKTKTLSIQAGATWKDVQDYLNPYGLAVKVQQASNIFTIGGSLSVNIHGRDPRYGPIIETIQGFHLLKADGEIVYVSRESNKELFGAVIGGYGLFGIVLDVDLSVTENHILEKKSKTLSVHEYVSFFQKNIRNHLEVELHYAWLALDQKHFLSKVLVATFETSKKKPTAQLTKLLEETGIERNKAFLTLSRKYEWGKSFRWFMQEIFTGRIDGAKTVSRNNAMRPEVAFLDYNSPTDTDILQEYFVPLEKLQSFVEGMKSILQKHKVNLLNSTIRYVPANDEAMLSYSKQESFAIVLYINQQLSQEGRQLAEKWTQELVNLALSFRGTYYLPYQLYPTKEQLQKAYPKFEDFLKLKRKHDPQERFVNQFYFKYK